MKMLFGNGIDSLRFGCDISNAVMMLGQPTKQWKDEYGSTFYAYYHLKLVLGFDSELENKLCNIEIQDKRSELDLIQSVWYQSKEDLIQLLSSDYELDILNEKAFLMFDGITFNFVLNEISSITLSVMFDEDDSPLFTQES